MVHCGEWSGSVIRRDGQRVTTYGRQKYARIPVYYSKQEYTDDAAAPMDGGGYSVLCRLDAHEWQPDSEPLPTSCRGVRFSRTLETTAKHSPLRPFIVQESLPSVCVSAARLGEVLSARNIHTRLALLLRYGCKRAAWRHWRGEWGLLSHGSRIPPDAGKAARRQWSSE